MKPFTAQPVLVVRPRELRHYAGISQTTAWRLEREGKFPKRRRLSSGAVGWLLSEIVEWAQNRETV